MRTPMVSDQQLAHPQRERFLQVNFCLSLAITRMAAAIGTRSNQFAGACVDATRRTWSQQLSWPSRSPAKDVKVAVLEHYLPLATLMRCWPARVRQSWTHLRDIRNKRERS